MDLSKQKRLVENLLEKTQVIPWEQSIKSDLYQVSFRNNTIRIGTTPSGESFNVEISLYNDSGELVEQFTDVDLQQDGPRISDDGGNWYKVMIELYQSARRKALGTDKILDDLIQDLEEVIPF